MLCFDPGLIGSLGPVVRGCCRSRSRSRSPMKDERGPPLALSWARLGLGKLGLSPDLLQQPLDDKLVSCIAYSKKREEH